jgi:hypothetical protein
MTTKERKKPRRNHTIIISDDDDEIDLYSAEQNHGNVSLRQAAPRNEDFYHPQQDETIVDLNLNERINMLGTIDHGEISHHRSITPDNTYVKRTIARNSSAKNDFSKPVNTTEEVPSLHFSQNIQSFQKSDKRNS